jgi:enterochelin esterase-like enzyme
VVNLLQNLSSTRRLAALAILVPGMLLALPGRCLAAPALTDDCRTVPSRILSRPVDVCVVLPADYNSSAPQRYPVLYYLHGLFENEHSWIDRGGQEILEGLLSSHTVGEFIVVLPNAGKSFYVNSYDGRDRYEDFFIQELVPWVDHTYRTFATRETRGIEGDSMGGYGSLHLAMRHSDIFGSATAQSAALIPKIPDPLPTEGRWGFYARILEQSFGSPLNVKYWDKNNPLTLAGDPSRFANLKLYFDCGTDDRYGFNEGAVLLDKILISKGFPHEFHLREGGHGWSYLTQYMQYPLMFHWRAFEAAEKGSAHTGGKGVR